MPRLRPGEEPPLHFAARLRPTTLDKARPGSTAPGAARPVLALRGGRLGDAPAMIAQSLPRTTEQALTSTPPPGSTSSDVMIPSSITAAYR